MRFVNNAIIKRSQIYREDDKMKNRMKKYQMYRQVLNELLEGHEWIQVEVPGFLKLNVEQTGMMNWISLAHTRIQNGDVMCVPEVRFLLKDINGLKIAFPFSYQDDNFGIYHEIYELNEQDEVTTIRQAVRESVEDFVDLWLSNLASQGFLKLEYKTIKDTDLV